MYTTLTGHFNSVLFSNKEAFKDQPVLELAGDRGI